MSQPTQHIVAFSFELWGHIRPLLAFVTRLMKVQRTITVTLIIDAKRLDKVRTQLARDLVGESSLLDSITILTLEKAAMTDSQSIESEFEEVYHKILDTATHPTVYIGEFGTYDTLSVVRKLSTRPIKVVLWYPGPLSALFSNVSRWSVNIDDLFAFDFTAKFDMTKEHSIPGMPTITANEFVPQQVRRDKLFNPVLLATKGTQMWLTSDVMLGGTSELFEPAQAEFMRSLMRKSGRDLFTLGAVDEQADSTQDVAEEVKAFMKGNLTKKGPKSVLYICFGSLTAIPDPTKLYTVLDVLIDMNIPFVLAHPEYNPPLPSDLSDRIAASELGLICKWAPQQYILAHPATGWFLSHCGFTSVLESFSAGVPIIGWPLTYDQPLVAIIVDQVLKCGYELEEVRTGFLGLHKRNSNGHQPVGTTDALVEELRKVFTSAFFDEGERAKKQAAVEQFSKEMNNAWNEDGVAFREMQRFTEFIGH